MSGKLWIVACLLVVGSLSGASAFADEKEVWEGVLTAKGVSLTLVVNIEKSPAGELTATLDSPDQGAKGIKVNTVALDKSKLLVEIKGLGIRFEGKLNDKGTEAKGNWNQGPNSTPLTLTKKSNDEIEKAKIVGKEDVWEGKLAVSGGIEIRMVFHLNKTAGGSYVGTFDSPDQGAKGIKLDKITWDKTSLKLEIGVLKARFEGKLNKDGTESVGSFYQGVATLPLTLKKVGKASEMRRPQTPKPPFPYKSENVSYPNREAGLSLAGTLTIPSGKGPFPAVIMITGSGSQDRDETLFGHKPFFVIADNLTRRGVAVLRVDDRGVGGSTGDARKSTTADFATDVAAGIAFLKTRADINPKKIGLIGHSEGGVIAPILAARSSDVAFIVLMAGTGLPGDDILRMQARLIYQAMGTKGDELEKALAAQARLIEIAKTDSDDKSASAKMKAVMDEAKKTGTAEELKKLEEGGTMIEAQLTALRSPWFRYFLTFDPRPTLAKVQCPVLAVVGSKDLQVPPKENLAEIEKALKKAGNNDVTIKELPDLNHLFQTCKIGSPTEYGQIEETLAPSFLTIMGDWIVKRVK